MACCRSGSCCHRAAGATSPSSCSAARTRSQIEHSTPACFEQLAGWERSALRPGVPDDLNRRPDVLVVGGGVQGLATAAACRDLGLGEVVLIERAHLAAGPSGSAAGTLCPDGHLDREGPAFVEFARASLARYEVLASEVERRLRLRWLDWLALTAPATAPRLAARPGVQHLDADDVRRLAPGLGVDTGRLLVPRGLAHVNPLRLAAVLASRAGALATGVEYRRLVVRRHHAEAVRTSRGDFQP